MKERLKEHIALEVTSKEEFNLVIMHLEKEGMIIDKSFNSDRFLNSISTYGSAIMALQSKTNTIIGLIMTSAKIVSIKDLI